VQPASSGPSGLSQSLGTTGTVTLTWTPVPGALSYTVTSYETKAPLTGASIDPTGSVVTLAAAPAGTLAVGASVSGGGFPGNALITAIGSPTQFTVMPPSPTAIGSSGATGVSLNVVVPTATPVLPVAPATVPAATYTTPVLTNGSTYAFLVTANTLGGTTVASSSGNVASVLTAQPPLAFTGTATAAGASATLTWANNPLNANNVTGLNLTWPGGPLAGFTFGPSSTGTTLTGMSLISGTSYTFTLKAVSNVTGFTSAPVTTSVVAAP